MAFQALFELERQQPSAHAAMVRSTLRSLARRYRSVLHETSGGSAQS
jgi:hypothetical protein